MPETSSPSFVLLEIILELRHSVRHSRLGSTYANRGLTALLRPTLSNVTTTCFRRLCHTPMVG